MHIIETATHVAYLDLMVGDGLLVLPLPVEDMTHGLPSLHEAGWGHMLGLLEGLGCEPSTHEDGSLIVDGYTRDGRQVVGLFVREPVVTHPSLDQCAESSAALASRAGLVPLAGLARS